MLLDNYVLQFCYFSCATLLDGMRLNSYITSSEKFFKKYLKGGGDNHL